VAIVGLALAAPPAEAQRWGRPRVPRAGACFYQNANFGGDYFCVGAGEGLDQMPEGLNDRISSIRTFGDVDVTVFRNPGFSGRSRRFDGDVSNLQQQGWNDTLSSLQVREVGRRGGFGGFGGDRGRGIDGGRGRGGSAEVDRIVRRAYQDVLGREPDPAGLREYRLRLLDDGWSEADVREALRRSPEFRQQTRANREMAREMSRQQAEEIVRRAYVSVLGREPDAGAQGFVTRVLRDNWSEQDVARELRKSPEYRNRRPPG
jgi:hypothetical protein